MRVEGRMTNRVECRRPILCGDIPLTSKIFSSKCNVEVYFVENISVEPTNCRFQWLCILASFGNGVVMESEMDTKGTGVIRIEMAVKEEPISSMLFAPIPISAVF